MVIMFSGHNHSVICRYRHAKDRAQRMVVIPRYEPVFVEPNLKQYEVKSRKYHSKIVKNILSSVQVQVLQMSMNLDDMDGGTGQRLGRQAAHGDIEARRQRFDPGFNLDSVSYITHDTSISETAIRLTI